MTLHRMNTNYISETDRMKKRFFRMVGEVMGWGNILGGIIFGLFILFDDRKGSIYEYPVPLGMILAGFFTLWIGKREINESSRKHLHAINYLFFPLIVFYFLDEAAVTFWAITFLYVIMALILQSTLLVFYSLIASMAVLVSLMLLTPSDVTVPVGLDDHIFRMVLLLIAAIMAVSGLRSVKKKEKLLFHYMDQAEETAFQDPLLKIPNRIDFNLYVDHELAASELLLWKLEINQFQSVYDILGHQKSDELLKMVNMRLTEKLESSVFLAKGEGSTFLIAAPGCIEEKEAEKQLEEILHYLSSPYVLGTHDYLLTFNIGAARSDLDGRTSDELMRHAQFALDNAKTEGINRVVFSSDPLKLKTMHQVQISEALYQADLDKEFHLVFQPQIELKTNQIVGVEALVRWNHPGMGIISPGIFIDIAEKNGFIVPLGKWILEKACQEVKLLSDSTGRPMKLAVNVSFIQIRQDAFVEETLDILKNTGFPPKRLEIELTERSLFENQPEDLIKLETLRSRGIRIAIDDFGTGYSSFGILAKVKVDKIKVRREFIDKVDSNPNSQRIVQTIASMADRFELTCLAEGIERLEESDFLHHLVCQEVQGFYYAKPAVIQQIQEWLELPREAVLAGTELEKAKS